MATTTERAQGAHLLREAGRHLQQQLQHLLELFFDEAEFRLFQAAQQTASGQQQGLLFETMTLLKQHEQDIKQRIALTLQRSLEGVPPPAPAAAEAAPLQLLELDTLEQRLSLENVARSITHRWFEPLYCLARRYSVLTGEEVGIDTLPVGVDNICRAIQDALLQQGVTVDMLPLLWRSFDSTVTPHLGNIYDVLNSRLKQAGVLPNLEVDLWRELSHEQRRSRDAQHRAAAPVDSAAAAPEPAAPEQDAPPPRDPGPAQALYETTREILGLLHTPATGAAAAPIAADHAALQRALQVLRNQPPSPRPLLSQLQQQLAAGGEARGLSTQDADLLRLIDSVFVQVDTALTRAPKLAEILQRLQLPLAAQALAQPQLFRDLDHPARRLIDQVVEVCAHSDLPNPPLEQKLERLTGPLLEAAPDTAAFGAAADALAQLLNTQHQVRERNIQRVVEAYAGRQQLAQAQAAVTRELQRRVASLRVPAVVVELLEQGWRELLTLTWIRHGESSDDWRDHLALLDELLWRLTGSGGERETEGEPLAPPGAADAHAVEQLAGHIGRQLEHLFPGDYHRAALAEKIRRTLLGELPVAYADSPWRTLPDIRSTGEMMTELEQAYPHLVRWFKRARSFAVGDEFTHLRDRTGTQRYTLVWIGEHQQHFVFVDQRGHRAFDFDLVDLANEMARGLHPVQDGSTWAATEQALFTTVQDVYQELAYRNTHDELTGLCNRKEFERLLGNAIVEAKHKQNQHALLYIDIDQFSILNNLLGHLAGDEVLGDVSRLLSERSPAGAAAARLGGNEFALLMYGWDLERGRQLGETLRREIAATPISRDQHRVDITASIGLVEINKYSDDTVSVLRNVISACSAAKEAGRNRVEAFRPDAELLSRREKLLTWIDKFTTVLEGDSLVLRAQPIRALNPAVTQPHYEILLGLRDEEGGLTSPSEFIAAAECYNRMQRVDRWVVERVFAWLDARARQGVPLPQLSVNLSGNSINDTAFMDFLFEQFGRHAVPPGNICFEVTETTTIDNLANAADFIREVKKIGCAFSLDDFGTGLSSYEYLKHLPVDYLKIDGTFITDIDRNGNDRAMVKSINEIAHFMGKRTIAEFVERDAVLAVLGEIGVDYAQGYGIGAVQLLKELD